MSFPEALQYAERLAHCIIPYELFDDMKSTSAALDRACSGDSIGIFIGPEGGFERGEVVLMFRIESMEPLPGGAVDWRENNGSISG